MSLVPRLIAALGLGLFLVACFYVGYVNEQLKGAIATWHRAIVMIGFILGASAASRYLMEFAGNALELRKRRRR